MPISNRKLKKLQKKERQLRYRKYLQSEKWQDIRSQLALIKGYQCERCDKDLKNGYFDVHHKTYKNIFKEKLEDLELLCRHCHKEEHKRMRKIINSKKQKSKKPLFSTKCKMLETKQGRKRLKKLGYKIKV